MAPVEQSQDSHGLQSRKHSEDEGIIVRKDRHGRREDNDNLFPNSNDSSSSDDEGDYEDDDDDYSETGSRTPSTPKATLAARSFIRIIPTLTPIPHSSILPILTTKTLKTTSFATPKIALPSPSKAYPLPAGQNAVASSGPPRKAFNGDSQPLVTITSQSSQTLSRGLVATASTGPAISDSSVIDKHALSPDAEHALIAVGTIGAFILVCFLIFVALRMLGIDIISRLSRNGSRGNSWKAQRIPEGQHDWDPSYAREKEVPTQRKLEAFYSPVTLPLGTTTNCTSDSGIAVTKANSERLALVREALRDNSSLYGSSTTRPHPELNPDPIRPSFNFSFNGIQSPPPAHQSSVPHNAQRLSAISSLSSGFGDEKIDMHGLGPVPPNTIDNPRKSIVNQISKNNFISRFSWTTKDGGESDRDTVFANQVPENNLVSRFSWTTKDGGKSDRDTVYTYKSEESTPRFRTVNSWVNQQSRSVERKKAYERELYNMPDISDQKSSVTKHIRGASETTNLAFRAHPGDEVEVVKGSRVPSAILDRKLGGYK